MKKILTLAIMAILLGGFAFNANAQERTTKPNEKKTTTTVKKDTKGDTTEKLLKEYENAVEQCVTLYNQMKKQDAKVDKKTFDKALSTAESLKARIDQNQKDLSRKQMERFNKATKKLSQVYAKG